MMNLHEQFLNVLKDKINDKRQLASIISEVLRIEREPALRRINGKVLFTVQEIGIIAIKLGISIDGLLNHDEDYNQLMVGMGKPNKYKSLDTLTYFVDQQLDICIQDENEQNEMGVVFCSLPVEFFVPFPHLSKFIVFKWRHNFIEKEEYTDYDTWEVPKNLFKYKDEFPKALNCIDKIIYIWDIPVIWTLVNEINYFYNIKLLRKKEMNLIKEDLFLLLKDIESLTKGSANRTLLKNNVQFYIPNVHIGVYSRYYCSKKNSYSYVSNNFMRSLLMRDEKTNKNIYNWINSMKSVSTLISGSGEKERKLFFDEQFKILNLYK